MALGLSVESKLLNLAINGDRRSLGKILTKIESGFEPNISVQKPWTLGVTGPPGAGKSTLIGALMSRWIKKGEKIAVLAVDPSSPKSGGALLADRIRMQGSEKSDSIFIRSIASRNHPGGLSLFIGHMINVLSASGWSKIIIETVGSGQSQTRIVAFADRILLVEGPDRGDIIQAEKAGILELADIVAVNKSDMPNSELAYNSLNSSLSLDEHNSIITHLVSALNGDGIDDLLSTIDECPKSSEREILRQKERLLSFWDSRLLNYDGLNELLVNLSTGSITLDEAVDIIDKR
uniref:LAO/AO transport system ATPase (ArgK) n=1 Tax=uncultured Poseidoniia archaeon TaxID=1697135 RepID=A0A1B1TC64_9ARCH|nr:LAO/AO transport system ATPase (argK) [uncultured Candidatus Thalassoarchaea sp.]